MITDDQIKVLVQQAHEIFGKHSIYEVMDMEDRESVLRTLGELYGPLDLAEVDRYLGIIDQLR